MLQNSQHLGGCDHFLFLCFPPDCMFMKETSVLKWSATENFCSNWICNGQLLLQSLFLPTLFLSLFLLLKDERERKRRRKNSSKQTPLPRQYKYRQRKGPLRCGWCETPQLSWKSVCTSILSEKVWCCVCMDFSTFLINESTKRGIQIWLFFFFFVAPWNNFYCLISLDVINLKHQ